MSIESAKVVKIRRAEDYNGMEAYWIEMDNGKTCSLNSKTGQPWVPGEVATYEIKGEYQGKRGPFYRITKKGNNMAPSNGSSAHTHSSGGWSKEKETSVMVQGLLKSIIESGTKSEFWVEALKKAIQTHNDAVAGILAKEQPVSAPDPTKLAQQYKSEGYKPDVHQPVGAFTQEEEGDLPF